MLALFFSSSREAEVGVGERDTDLHHLRTWTWTLKDNSAQLWCHSISVLLQGICNMRIKYQKPWCAVDVDIGVYIRADPGLLLLYGPSLCSPRTLLYPPPFPVAAPEYSLPYKPMLRTWAWCPSSLPSW